MKTLFFLVIVIGMASWHNLQAQVNLVPNPSFENHNGVPRPSTTGEYPNKTNLQALHCVMRGDSTLTLADPRDYIDSGTNFVLRWFRANCATTDYYHRNANAPASPFPIDQGVKVPSNWGVDSLEAVTGDAYAGIAITRRRAPTSGVEDHREYLAARLDEPLQYGKTYSVKFKYSTSQYVRNSEGKVSGNVQKYYLKKLGVAFLDTTAPLLNRYSFNTPLPLAWINDGAGSSLHHALEFDSASYILVQNAELPYAQAPDWGTFEAYFFAGNYNLKYMVIGNFDQRISLNHIKEIPPNFAPTDDEEYLFYFYIDDVEVKELVTEDSCNCTSIFTCPHTRNDSLEQQNAEKCCFTTPVRPRSISCDFRYVRVKENGTTVSKPPIVDYGSIVPTDSTFEVSFCTTKKYGEEYVEVIIEFLDEDSNVVCIKKEYAFCNCPCYYADDPIAPGVPVKVIAPTLKKVANDNNGNCCWEFSVKNNYSCNFRDSVFRIQASVPGGIITPISPWTGSFQNGVYNFYNPNGLDPNSNSNVFRVCIPPSINPRTLDIRMKSMTDNNMQCHDFPPYTLECQPDTNCCDLLEVQLRKKSELAYGDCQFEVIVRQKNSPAKCKVFGVRIRKAADSLIMHSTGTSGTPLDLDDYTYIWEDDLGSDCPQSLTPGYQKSRTYIIEFLDSTGAVKCSTQKTFQCCYSSGGPSSSKQGTIEESTQKQTSLSIGGSFTNITLDAKHLRYTFTNYDEQDNGRAWIALVDIRGQKVIEKPIALRPGTNSGDIDIMGIHNGTYYLVLRTDKWQTSKQCSIIK